MAVTLRPNVFKFRATLLFITGLVVIQLLTPPALMIFSRDAIHHGELWRLISGHFIHASWTHLSLNIAGLFVCQILFRLQTGFLLTLSISAALIISCGLLLFTDYDHYLGLSGVLHALFITGAITTLFEDEHDNWLKLVPAAGTLLLLLAKLISEIYLGSNPDQEHFIGMSIAVEAHWLGLGAGLIFLTLYWVRAIFGRASA